jgi:acetoacetyl-CoA reductase/3-oxoacyl-[acyl-carrier protein] reductase
MSLAGRLAVVTGGAGGIGRACAQALAQEGARIALIDRDEVALGELTADLRGRGIDATPVRANLTSLDSIVEATREIERQAGSIDILVNNVGQSGRERACYFTESDLSTFEFLLDINLRMTVWASRQVIGAMKARGWGRIINIASEAAFTGGPRSWDYAAAKAGVIGFTRALGREMAQSGITVNAIGPGLIRTTVFDTLLPEVQQEAIRATPMGPGDPEDIANAVVFFARPASRHITGQTLLVNGGSWML